MTTCTYMLLCSISVILLCQLSGNQLHSVEIFWNGHFKTKTIVYSLCILLYHSHMALLCIVQYHSDIGTYTGVPALSTRGPDTILHVLSIHWVANRLPARVVSSACVQEILLCSQLKGDFLVTSSLTSHSWALSLWHLSSTIASYTGN